MDTREIIQRLKPFIAACKKAGYDFSRVYLMENLEGFPPAGYHLYFKADWIGLNHECDSLVDNLVDIYIQTITDPEVKRNIHYFSVTDELGRPHCWDYPIVYQEKESV